MPTRFIAMATLGFVMLGAALFLYFGHLMPFPSAQKSLRQASQQATTTLPTATSQTLPQPVVPTKTYTNKQYGFSFQYPADIQINITDYFGSIIPLRYRSGVTFFAEHGSIEGTLVINASTVSSEISRCLMSGVFSGADYTPVISSSTSNISINSISFSRYDVVYNYGVVNGIERDYATLHNGTCYAIGLTALPSGGLLKGRNPDSNWEPDEDTTLTEFERIVQTFQLTK